MPLKLIPRCRVIIARPIRVYKCNRPVKIQGLCANHFRYKSLALIRILKGVNCGQN